MSNLATEVNVQTANLMLVDTCNPRDTLSNLVDQTDLIFNALYFQSDLKSSLAQPEDEHKYKWFAVSTFDGYEGYPTMTCGNCKWIGVPR